MQVPDTARAAVPPVRLLAALWQPSTAGERSPAAPGSVTAGLGHPRALPVPQPTRPEEAEPGAAPRLPAALPGPAPSPRCVAGAPLASGLGSLRPRRPLLLAALPSPSRPSEGSSGTGQAGPRRQPPPPQPPPPPPSPPPRPPPPPRRAAPATMASRCSAQAAPGLRALTDVASGQSQRSAGRAQPIESRGRDLSALSLRGRGRPAAGTGRLRPIATRRPPSAVTSSPHVRLSRRS